MEFIINRAYHSVGSLDAAGEEIAAAREKRFRFDVYISTEGDSAESTDMLEVYLSATPGEVGAGFQVSAAMPLIFDQPYYGAISARAVGTSATYALVECIG